MRYKKGVFLGLVAIMIMTGCGKNNEKFNRNFDKVSREGRMSIEDSDTIEKTDEKDNIDSSVVIENNDNSENINNQKLEETVSLADEKKEVTKVYFWSSNEEVEKLNSKEILELGNHYNTCYYFDLDELYRLNLFDIPLEPIIFSEDYENCKQEYDNLGEYITCIIYDEFDDNSLDVDYSKVIDNDTLYKYIKAYDNSCMEIEYKYNEKSGYGNKLTNHIYEECGEDTYYVSTRSIADFTRYFSQEDEGDKLRQGVRYFCYNNLVENYKYDMYFLGDLNVTTVRDTFDIYSFYKHINYDPIIYRCVNEDSNGFVYTFYSLHKIMACIAGESDKIAIDKTVISIDKVSRKVSIDEEKSFMSAEVPGTTIERSIVE